MFTYFAIIEGRIVIGSKASIIGWFDMESSIYCLRYAKGS